MLKSHPLSGVDRSNFAPRQALKQSPTSAFLRYLIPVDSCLIKRSSIKDVQFSTDLKQGEDTFFWLQLAHRGCRFELLEETLVFIRRHGANTTRSVQDYVTEIPACYRKIQQAGLAPARSDTFLVKLKLFYFRWKVNKLSALPLLLGLLQYPILLLGETFKFFTVTLRDRKRLLKYYFSD